MPLSLCEAFTLKFGVNNNTTEYFYNLSLWCGYSYSKCSANDDSFIDGADDNTNGCNNDGCIFVADEKGGGGSNNMLSHKSSEKSNTIDHHQLYSMIPYQFLFNPLWSLAEFFFLISDRS